MKDMKRQIREAVKLDKEYQAKIDNDETREEAEKAQAKSSKLQDKVIAEMENEGYDSGNPEDVHQYLKAQGTRIDEHFHYLFGDGSWG